MKADSSQYSFIMYTLSKRGMSQVMLAKLCKCSPQFINAVIQGKKTSSVIEDRIAKFLGFRNWSHLQIGVYNFEVMINQDWESSRTKKMMGASEPASIDSNPIRLMLPDIKAEG